MKSGYKNKLISILKDRHLGTVGSIGLVLTGARSVHKALLKAGFNVEYGEGNILYSFIYIPKKRVNAVTILNYLTKLDSCGIILFREGQNIFIMSERK